MIGGLAKSKQRWIVVFALWLVGGVASVGLLLWRSRRGAADTDFVMVALWQLGDLYLPLGAIMVGLLAARGWAARMEGSDRTGGLIHAFAAAIVINLLWVFSPPALLVITDSVEDFGGLLSDFGRLGNMLAAGSVSFLLWKDSAGYGQERAKLADQRTTLIPEGCRLDITPPRLKAISGELRRLELEPYPNAIAVLFRVFLELSVDQVVSTDKLMIGQEYSNASLSAKMQKVANHLENKGRLSQHGARAVKKAASDQHLLDSSVTTFHNYVHNEHFSASPADLRGAWDKLQPLFETIWVSPVARERPA